MKQVIFVDFWQSQEKQEVSKNAWIPCVTSRRNPRHKTPLHEIHQLRVYCSVIRAVSMVFLFLSNQGCFKSIFITQ